MAKFMSQKAYAESIGVSKQYINRLVREGILPTQNGRIDPEFAGKIIDARREPARDLRRHAQAPAETAPVPAQSAPVPADGRRPLTTAELPTLLLKTRIKSETEKAKLLEIKAKVEAGKYIDVDIVTAAAFKRGRIIRDGMLAIPDRIDAVVAAETDRRKVHKIMTDEITRVLEEFSKPPF